jgi:uncharacterized protein YodC (DUF2158 family)
VSYFNDLRIGDLVVLNSGGPLMTVEALFAERERVECMWFHSNPVVTSLASDKTKTIYGEMQRGYFFAATLTKKAV